MPMSIFISPPPTYLDHFPGSIQVSVTSLLAGKVKLTLPSFPQAYFDNNQSEIDLSIPAGAVNQVVTFHFTIHKNGVGAMATQFTTHAVDTANVASPPFPIAVNIL